MVRNRRTVDFVMGRLPDQALTHIKEPAATRKRAEELLQARGQGPNEGVINYVGNVL